MASQIGHAVIEPWQPPTRSRTHRGPPLAPLAFERLDARSDAVLTRVGLKTLAKCSATSTVCSLTVPSLSGGTVMMIAAAGHPCAVCIAWRRQKVLWQAGQGPSWIVEAQPPLSPSTAHVAGSLTAEASLDARPRAIWARLRADGSWIAVRLLAASAAMSSLEKESAFAHLPAPFVPPSSPSEASASA